MAWVYPSGISESFTASGEINTGWQPQNFLYGSKIVLGEAGTVTQAGLYCYHGSGGGPTTIKFGLYDSSGNLIVQTTGAVSGFSYTWIDSGTFSEAVSAGTYFLVVSAADENPAYPYVSGASDSSISGSRAYASAMADPQTFSNAAESMGVRLDFTAGASGPSIPVLRNYQSMLINN